jgi:hypothetical protein
MPGLWQTRFVPGTWRSRTRPREPTQGIPRPSENGVKLQSNSTRLAPEGGDSLSSCFGAPVVPGSSLALIGNASAREIGVRPRSPIRGIFDKETRRKPLAFAADAAAMAIGGWFGTGSPRRIVGGLLEWSGCHAVSAGKGVAEALAIAPLRECRSSRTDRRAGVRVARPSPNYCPPH